MTFSIVGREPDGTAVGVAVASKFLAVGAAVPAARRGVGAVATQSFANTLFKRDGLAHLASGLDADATLAALLEADEGREERQVGVVDHAGRAATFSGSGCLDWAGGVTGPGYAIQGNILVGPQVVDAMQAAWLGGEGMPLADRLLLALTAGDAAGGDSRGRQSAALLVASGEGSYTPGDDVRFDLRVDDHVDPVTELSRLLDLHHLYFDAPHPDDLLPLTGDLADEVAGLLAAVGRPDLATWAGVENFELRLVDGQIDRVVLSHLRAQADQNGR
ncbi:DUF1028 domain-containing protein [Solicola sp. PLA-1-18]|uniref:DUF1028 domain-containing protein n=1 Tax=Solicola sp. PLA-1-18 TaxID=3380532 RepID=UPI003B7846A8